ncbi:MAG: sulfatase [OM182 bacterium]|nr:MAG: sulfatase [OM182 bacterium]HBK19650.1 sulfatase [Gammaproteobacteria bacterium]
MWRWSLMLLALISLAGAAWQYRIEMVVKVTPFVRGVLSPIAENQPIVWPQEPTVGQAAPDARPPNIILILTDDMGFNDISLYNGGAADGSLKTPSIDALAQQGVSFSHGYAANAVCAPTRATLLTGRYSTRFGFEFTPIFKLGPTIFKWMNELEPPPLPVEINVAAARALPGIEALGMPGEEITIAEVLRDRGYYTAHIGKWHLGGMPGMRPEDQGFDDSLYMAGTLYLPEAHRDVVNAKREKDPIERMVWATGRYAAQFNGGPLFQPEGYLTDYFSREAVKVIEANGHRPFFLYLAHWGIHNPLQATREDYARFSHIEDHHLRVYAAMTHALDRGVGMLTAALEAQGLADNTLIVFTSDNGGADYIGLPDINQPFRGWKLTHFEGGIHVPFMAKWPARIPQGTRYAEPVHHIDVFHTLAAAAGAEIPGDRKLDGVNLLPYVTGEAGGRPHETLFWREGHQQTVWHQGWKLIRAEHPAQAPGDAASERVWLFHLAQDPTEQVNLAQDRPDKVQALKALLAAHNAEQAEPLWPSVINAPIRVDKVGDQPYVEGDEYIYWPN